MQTKNKSQNNHFAKNRKNEQEIKKNQIQTPIEERKSGFEKSDEKITEFAEKRCENEIEIGFMAVEMNLRSFLRENENKSIKRNSEVSNGRTPSVNGEQ